MNEQLWQQILEFNLDNTDGEYNFSLRLANENYWSIGFTHQAIFEYKKFMYLAATSEQMVSPSPIVDVVWHQHLIFTQSYNEFCGLLGKQIQHIPSTHNPAEFQKFKLAKERTKRLYSASFGEQPAAIWEAEDMYAGLHLDKAKYKLRSFVAGGILGFILLTIPAFFLLKPIYVEINNPGFVFNFIGFGVATFLGLEIFNRYRLRNMVNQFDKDAFINNLEPYEVIYLQQEKLFPIINGTVNELVENGTIRANEDKTMELFNPNKAITPAQQQAAGTLHLMGTTNYPALLRNLLTKPIFTNIANSMEAFRKYVLKSKKFGVTFYVNFIVLATLLLFAFTRFLMGVARDKPIAIILFTTAIALVIAVVYLKRLTKMTFTTIIPTFYKDEILPERPTEDWQWSYFVLGNAALATAFLPMANYVERNNKAGATNHGGCGGGCGSSCGGSSCSGGCSGCGGGN